uniref:Uncharacterized protein n=1 Tax=Anguilla anguilla TaxID=7936 RepID=A0A0E9WLT6_ANGAN
MKSSSSSVLHLIDTSSCGWSVLVILSPSAGSVGMLFFLLFKMKMTVNMTTDTNTSSTVTITMETGLFLGPHSLSNVFVPAVIS